MANNYLETSQHSKYYHWKANDKNGKRRFCRQSGLETRLNDVQRTKSMFKLKQRKSKGHDKEDRKIPIQTATNASFHLRRDAYANCVHDTAAN